MKSPIIKDVSNMAGVAPSTVSLVINNSPRVSPETRAKVMKAIEALDYMPNSYAASLRQTRKSSYGVLVPDVQNPYYLEIIQGLKAKCESNGIILQISETDYDINKEKQELNYMKSIKVSGYVFIGTSGDEQLIGELEGRKIVFIDKIDKTGKIPYILIDNRQSVYETTTYLINKGCKKIYYVTQTLNTEVLLDRLEGYKKAMKEHGMDPDNHIIISNDLCLNKLEAGYNCIKNILNYDKPDGVVATSDMIALGILRGLYEKKIKVPEEVSVIGFDNIEYSQYCIPSLTTVNQPRLQMGEIAFAYLAETDLNISRNNKILLKSDFIIRESVKT